MSPVHPQHAETSQGIARCLKTNCDLCAQCKHPEWHFPQWPALWVTLPHTTYLPEVIKFTQIANLIHTYMLTNIHFSRCSANIFVKVLEFWCWCWIYRGSAGPFVKALRFWHWYWMKRRQCGWNTWKPGPCDNSQRRGIWFAVFIIGRTYIRTYVHSFVHTRTFFLTVQLMKLELDRQMGPKHKTLWWICLVFH